VAGQQHIDNGPLVGRLVRSQIDRHWLYRSAGAADRNARVPASGQVEFAGADGSSEAKLTCLSPTEHTVRPFALARIFRRLQSLFPRRCQR